MVVEYNGTVTLTDENYLTTSNAGNTANVTTKSPTTINSVNRVTGQYTNATSVNFLATFGATVTGVTASNFSVTATGVTGVTNANIGTPTTGDGGITWTVPVTTGTGDGTIQLNLANATGLSKTITTSLPFAGQAYTIDKTAPTVVISSTASDPTSVSPIPVKLTFSENVTGFTAANVSVNPGTISNFTGSGNVYTFDIVTGSLTTYTVNIATGQITDLAGNTNSVAASFSIVFTSPLAVQLISFTAAAKTNGTVALNWKIASEQNNDHYLLERSTDGINFNTLSIVPAQAGGNSSSELTYSFVDNKPAAGKDYYRLTQYDKDGKTKQLGIQVVQTGKATGNWTMYPNPASKDFTITLPGSPDGKKLISILDASGKIIYRAAIMSNAGRVEVKLEKSLISGVYTVQVDGYSAQLIIFK